MASLIEPEVGHVTSGFVPFLQGFPPSCICADFLGSIVTGVGRYLSTFFSRNAPFPVLFLYPPVFPQSTKATHDNN